MSDWIKFTEVDVRDGRKTKVWCVWTIDGAHLLGRIGWYSPWRKYAFTPTPGDSFGQVILEEECLTTIAVFLVKATTARRQERKKEKENLNESKPRTNRRTGQGNRSR